MTEASRRHWLTGFNTDLRAGALVALFAIVIGGALLLRPTSAASSATPAFEGSSTTTQVAGGIIWAIAEAIFAGLLLLTLLLFRQLPDWLQKALSKAAAAAFFMIAGAYAALTNQFPGLFATVIVLFVWVYGLDANDLWWVGNDVLAIAIAIGVGVMAGVVLGPIVIAAGLIGLTVYDHVFADRADWMFDLAGWSMRRRLPTVFVVPASLRMDWMELIDAFDEDGRDPKELMQFGIGMADLALPAAFAVAVAQSGGGLPLFGALAGLGVACGRISYKLENGGGAGLPPIVSGTLGGWALALLPGVIYAWT